MRAETERRYIDYGANPDTFTTDKGLTVESGNLTVTSGDLVLTAGDITQTGDLTVTGDIDAIGAVGSAQASASAGAEFRMIHKQVEHTVVGGGITETLTAAIPANAWVAGVNAKIKTTVVAATGVSFLIGVTGDTNRFGNFAALTQNTVQTPADHQAEAVGVGRFYAAATDVLLTLNAGTFTSGVVVVDIYYFDLSPSDDF